MSLRWRASLDPNQACHARATLSPQNAYRSDGSVRGLPTRRVAKLNKPARALMRAVITVSVCLVFCLSAACGDDSPGSQPSEVGIQGKVVGGPCSAAQRCAAGSKCETDGDFPNGTCAKACSSDADCPAATACISSKGGICLLTCTTSDECRAGYPCQAKSRESASGDTKVCIK